MLIVNLELSLLKKLYS